MLSTQNSSGSHFLVNTILGVVCFASLLTGKLVAQSTDGNETIRIKSALVKIAETVDVPAEQSGVLVDLKVEPGQKVNVGDLVARVNDEALLLKLEHARLEHELAKMAAASRVDLLYSQKSHDVAVSDLRRSQSANMRVPNSVAQSKLEKLALEKDRTELKLEQAQRDLQMAAFSTRLTSSKIQLAQSELAKATIKAPMNGLVVSVEKRVGEWVEANNVICKIVRTDRLWIEGLLPALQAAQIKVGSPVEIQFPQSWIECKNVPGKMVYISPEANAISGMVQVRAEFANDQANVPTGLKADIILRR